MRSETTAVGIFSAALLGFIGSAVAQNIEAPPRYDIQSMNFDLWCQETVRLPVERCNQRRPADVRAFEDFRAVIQRQELQYLMERDRAAKVEERVYQDYAAPWRLYEDPSP